MELSGKIFKVLPLVEGEGSKGKWKKQELVIEIPGKFVKKVCVSIFGDLATKHDYMEGTEISVEFDPESREYNNRWYTELKVWRINKIDESGPKKSIEDNWPKADQGGGGEKEEKAPGAELDDDLPFRYKTKFFII